MQSCGSGCNYYEGTDSAICHGGFGDSWDPVTKCCDCEDGSMTCTEGDDWAQDGDYTTAGIPADTDHPRSGKFTGFWPEYTDSVVEAFKEFYDVRLNLCLCPAAQQEQGQRHKRHREETDQICEATCHVVI